MLEHPTRALFALRLPSRICEATEDGKPDVKSGPSIFLLAPSSLGFGALDSSVARCSPFQMSVPLIQHVTLPRIVRPLIRSAA